VSPANSPVITEENTAFVPINIGKQKENADNGYTILVVDDKEVQRQLVKLLLNQLGYDAILANNGQVALEIIQSNPVDLVFMDIQMPVMNGFEAALPPFKAKSKKHLLMPSAVLFSFCLFY